MGFCRAKAVPLYGQLTGNAEYRGMKEISLCIMRAMQTAHPSAAPLVGLPPCSARSCACSLLPKQDPCSAEVF